MENEIFREALELGRAKNVIAGSPLLPTEDHLKRSGMLSAWRALVWQSNGLARHNDKMAVVTGLPTTRSWLLKFVRWWLICQPTVIGESGHCCVVTKCG